MIHKKDSHFIPSEYKAVTEYEDEFIALFNSNLAAAVTDVLKYIAKITAAAVKSNSIIEKAVNTDLKTAEKSVELNPSEKQIEAGNYKKGHTNILGFDITIENPKNSVRSGVDKGGKEWSIKMNNTYGYIKGTNGKDGDHIDIFLGDNLESDKVFVVDQFLSGKFDEHKVMLGFNTIKQAKNAYLKNYSKGWRGLKFITESSVDDFRKWIEIKTKKQKPFSEYNFIKENDI